MEFAIHQPLKIYSGGLGFLSGSHLRSAYELRQNMVGIGILWKYGYYDQTRNQDQTLQPAWMEKNTSFAKIEPQFANSPEIFRLSSSIVQFDCKSSKYSYVKTDFYDESGKLVAIIPYENRASEESKPGSPLQILQRVACAN